MAGLIPMHYAGLPADIDGLLDIADEHDLTVIWDVCHAFGGTWRGDSIDSRNSKSAATRLSRSMTRCSMRLQAFGRHRNRSSPIESDPMYHLYAIEVREEF